MSVEFDFGGEVVWRPTPEILEQANLTRFMRMHDVETFETLLERSSQQVEWFTEAVLDYLQVRFRVPYDRILDLSRGIAWPRWCSGGVMNIVDNCLDKHLHTQTAGRLAMAWEGEEGTSAELTYGELAREVNRAANALRALGLRKGDAIGLFMPMTPEVVIALLAIAKIGAVILPLFSGYGAGAIASRLADAGARALFTADGFYRRGAIIGMKETADAAAARVPTLEHMIVLRRTGAQTDMRPGRDHWWHEFVETQSDEAQTEATSAEDLLMIIYTSGTTGRPKGAVHTHCGFPIKAAQDMAFGTDIHPGDRLYWMSDMGWMMGPWLVFGALLLGSSFVIYDGALMGFALYDQVSSENARLAFAVPNATGEAPAWSPDGEHLVFPEIVLLPETVLGADSVEERPPQFFSHLQRVAVGGGAQVDLSGDENLLVEDTGPAYSPEGTWIAFSRRSLDLDTWTLGRQIWRMRSDGANPTPLTAQAELNHGGLAWSPDGTRLAYVLFDQVNPSEPAEIWWRWADGRDGGLIVGGGYGPKWIP